MNFILLLYRHHYHHHHNSYHSPIEKKNSRVCKSLRGLQMLFWNFYIKYCYYFVHLSPAKSNDLFKKSTNHSNLTWRFPSLSLFLLNGHHLLFISIILICCYIYFSLTLRTVYISLYLCGRVMPITCPLVTITRLCPVLIT